MDDTDNAYVVMPHMRGAVMAPEMGGFCGHRSNYSPLNRTGAKLVFGGNQANDTLDSGKATPMATHVHGGHGLGMGLSMKAPSI